MNQTKSKSKEEKRRKTNSKRRAHHSNSDDDDDDQASSWIEKPSIRSLPQTTSSNSTSNLSIEKSSSSQIHNLSSTHHLQDSSTNHELDFFNSLGKEMRGASVREEAEKQKATQAEENRMSSNIVRLGAGDPNYKPNDDPPAPPSKPILGGPGYQWRMRKLKRTYETAVEENRSIEEVAIERYGSLSAWEAAQEESRLITGSQPHHQNTLAESSKGSLQSTPARETSDRKYLFSSESGSVNRPAFRRPMSGRETPASEKDVFTPSNQINAHRRIEHLRQESSSKFGSPSSSSGPSSPVPSALNPLASISSSPRLSEARTGTTTLDLNKLQAALLKAKMMGSDTVPELEKKYGAALKAKSEEIIPSSQERVEVVPTLDGRGKMYDLGSGKADESGPFQPGNRRKKEAKVETRDSKTGELLRYNADDDQLSLQDLVRQEKFQAGSADQKNMDAEMARSIMTDSKYENDLDYIDDNADRLAKKKMKTDASKRLFAINDYSRTKKALDSCQFCYGDDGSHPKIGIISSGTKVYLCPPMFEELVRGHCWIVPMQHVLCSLELDDDAWDEIKNYMKCLMRMFSEKFDQGVLFYETVLSFKQQRHTYIEAVPISWDLFSDAPAYFKESILTSESEWSQHKKLIDFSSRPGGFRRSMVSNLPYFMVQWDYKGEKGYGHVIEGNDESSGRAGRGENGEEEISSILDEEGKGGEFPRYFAAEIIGNLLDLEPRKWRKPKRLANHVHQKEVQKFQDQLGYSKYDWTGLLTQ
ncbi:CwfJ C-terminus 1-domain-containing protein-like protein [Melampsora americana]|nr:CwfJ C-terminus 1-domain-containing protein-like protein [Melampsora americana]